MKIKNVPVDGIIAIARDTYINKTGSEGIMLMLILMVEKDTSVLDLSLDPLNSMD